MTVILNEFKLDRLIPESGRRTRIRRPLISPPDLSAVEWLHRTTHDLPATGQLRFAAGPQGIELLCDLPHDRFRESDPRTTACDFLETCLSTSQSVSADSESSAVTMHRDDIETALDNTGMPWSRHDDRWTAAPSPEVTLSIEPVAGGVRVVVCLAAWESDSSEALPALAEFLLDVQFRISGARCEFRGRAATAASFVPQSQLEEQMEPSLRSVHDVARRFGRAAQSLLNPAVAQQYRRFRESQPDLSDCSCSVS